MLKKLLLTAALVAATAGAQENTDISGANFQSGKADATLAALGRKAAASGARLIITAPQDWHAKIAAKVKAGGKADLVLRNGFYETVLVRVEDKASKEKAAAPEVDRAKAEAQRSRAEVEKAKAEAEAAKAQAETAKAEAEKAKAEAEKANAEAETAKAQVEAERAAAEKARIESERVAAEKAAAEKAAASAKPATAAQAAPAVASGDVRARMEKAINDGRPAAGTLTVSKLQSEDTLYVDGDQIAVVRRDRGKPLMYWLEGQLDLRRTELQETAPNRYKVLGMIRGEGTLRREFTAAKRIEAQIPAANAPARVEMEKSLNNGQSFSDTLHPADLRRDDVLYVDGNTVAVARRDGFTLTRYWLVGALDLNQEAIQSEAPNRYRVVRDRVR